VAEQLKMDREDIRLLKRHIRQLDKEQLISLFISFLKKEPEEVRIPVSVFKAGLSSLELIVKYLKEELEYSNKRIALLLLRSPQNIWITYRNAKQKYDKKLIVKESPYDIPLRILADEKLSTLEAIVRYLKDTHKLKYKEIAEILHRNEKTITTVYYRGKKRLG